MTIGGMSEARAEKRGAIMGSINSGRRYLFSDDIIIEDIAAQIGCSQQEAAKILYDFEHV